MWDARFDCQIVRYTVEHLWIINEISSVKWENASLKYENDLMKYKNVSMVYKNDFKQAAKVSRVDRNIPMSSSSDQSDPV